MFLPSNHRAPPASHNVPNLDIGGNYVLWLKMLTNVLKEKAPNVASEIQKKQKRVWPTLILDDVKCIGRKPITQHEEVKKTLTDTQKMLPVFDLETDVSPSLLCTTSDIKFYYSVIRRSEFLGDVGRSRYDLLVKTLEYNKDRYINKELPYTWSLIIQLLSFTLLSKVEIPKLEFVLKQNENDVMWLLAKIEQATIGGGTRAVGQSLLQITQLQMKNCDNDFIRFTHAFNEQREKLQVALQTMPANTDFVKLLFDVLYTFGLSQSNNQFIKLKIQNNLSNNDFADVDLLQTELMTLISNYEGIMNSSSNEQGVLYQANVAKKVATFVTKCYNCWRDGHRINECTQSLATCQICNIKGHCTKAHEKATAANLRRLNRPTHYSNNNPAPDSPKEILESLIARRKIQPPSSLPKKFKAHVGITESSQSDHPDYDAYTIAQLSLQNDSGSINNDELTFNNNRTALNASIQQADDID